MPDQREPTDSDRDAALEVEVRIEVDADIDPCELAKLDAQRRRQVARGTARGTVERWSEDEG